MSSSLCLQVSSIVGLINLVSREVGRIDIGGKLGLERCSDSAQAVKVNTAEKLVLLDFFGTSSAKTTFVVADNAGLYC